MKITERKEVEINICDICGKRKRFLSSCVVCGKDMCFDCHYKRNHAKHFFLGWSIGNDCEVCNECWDANGLLVQAMKQIIRLKEASQNAYQYCRYYASLIYVNKIFPQLKEDLQYLKDDSLREIEDGKPARYYKKDKSDEQ